MRSHAEHEESYLTRLGLLFPDLAQPDAGAQNPEASKEAGPSVEAEPSQHAISPRRAHPPESSPEEQVPLGARVRRFTAIHMKVLSALGLAAVIFSTWIVMHAHSVSLDESAPTPTWSAPVASASPEPVEMWMIHVLGAVMQPGVISVPKGARVIDAIEAAGGFSPQADAAELNLAAVLVDGSQIRIGTQDEPNGEVRQGMTGEPAGQQTGTSGNGTVNLNTAAQAELETLPGVGPVTAAAILAWRQKNGSFSSVGQLQEVSGIGPKTYAQIEPFASV